jgi:phosphoribosylformylglycinamidine synthase
LLISALGQIDDVASCVTMDLKHVASAIYLVGETKEELGGSHFCLIHDLQGGQVPTVDPQRARRTFSAIHEAISADAVDSCHDLSEGGLAVAMAEMCFAGGIGAELDLSTVPRTPAELSPVTLLFAESNTRFLCEVSENNCAQFESILAEVPHARVGTTTAEQRLKIVDATRHAWIDVEIEQLKSAWKKPFLAIV